MSANTVTVRTGNASQGLALPRLGFLGAGWIGRHRLEAIARSGLAEIAAIADPAAENTAAARALAPGAALVKGLEDLLAAGLDGLVIATPSALHARQAAMALDRGIPVFCQKPLGRNVRETRLAVHSAREADVLLGVDLSYRHVVGMQLIREQLRAGAIGAVFAVDLVFHNAYGPDKPWYYDLSQSGGGCVLDLGIHLIDLALWALDYPEVENVTSRLYAGGAALTAGRRAVVEDYAAARIDLKPSASLNMACSWGISAGQDCAIEATFRGTHGALSLHNLNGSFYEICAEHFQGTRREILDRVDDAWGGRAALAWAQRLAQSKRFDPEVQHLVAVSEVIDAIYNH